MRRRELLAKIAQQANSAGKDWTQVRTGGRHDIWRCGQTQVSIPRHVDVNQLTAEGIMKDLEAELGKGWWRQ